MNNLLVTGGSGFIGVNFIRYLLMESDFQGRIINLDKLTYAANPESLAEIQQRFPERYVFVKGDISECGGLDAVFDDYGIDAVCHFAAESHVDRSIASPGDFINTNIVGTYNLLEAVRERTNRVRLFHHISTDEVFGSLGEEGYFTEDTAYNPTARTRPQKPPPITSSEPTTQRTASPLRCPTAPTTTAPTSSPRN